MGEHLPCEELPELEPLPPPTKKITYMVIGDPHFKVENIVHMKEMATATLELARDRQPTFIVVLGDVLDTHSRMDQPPHKGATEWLGELSLIAPLYLIVGNHDRMSDYDFLTTMHPFTALKRWPNTHVVDQGLITEIEGCQFIFIPYVYKGLFEKALQHICTSHLNPMSGGNLGMNSPEHVRQVLERTTAGFSHQEYRGCKIGPVLSTLGDPWPLDRPVMINGHIHEHGWVQPNIVNAGTPVHHSGRERDAKTISIFTVVPQDPNIIQDGILSTTRVVDPATPIWGIQLPLRHRAATTVVEERVTLNVTPQIEIKTRASEFEGTEPDVDPTRCHFSWVVEGTRAELLALKTLEKWKRWYPYIKECRKPDITLIQTLPSDGGNVGRAVPASQLSTGRATFSDTRPYMTVLYDEAKIAGLEDLYKEIFV